MLAINPKTVETVTEQLRGKVPYGWGSKIDTRIDFAHFAAIAPRNGIDCSGYVDWVCRWASNGSVAFPEGSIAIGEHLFRLSKNQTVVQCAYSTASRNDDCLRIAGFDHGGKNRHVWCVVNGQTCESHGKSGGISGIDRRTYDHKSLMDNVQWCYLVANAKTLPPSLPDGFNLNVQMLNADGSSRGSIAAIAGLTSSGRAVILANQLPEIFGDYEVSYDAPNLVIKHR